jgi:hypothetical protein
MNKFIVVKFIVDGESVIALDYPKNYPLPSKGDILLMTNDGKEYNGKVSERIFTLKKNYREILLLVNCD